MKIYILSVFILVFSGFNLLAQGADIYLSRGSAISVESTDADADLEAFTVKPKVYGLIDGKKAPMRVVTKVTKKTPKDGVIVEWKKMVKLYDKKDYRKIQKGPKLINDPIADKEIDSIDILARKDVGKIPKSLPNKIFIAAPVVTEITGDRINAKDEFIVTGKYFGQKLPKIMVEYQRKGKWKYKRCKVDRVKSYIYQDARGRDNKSCMKILDSDLTDGEDVGFSKITVQYPKLKSIDARSGYLIIDNNMGINSYKMLSLTSDSFELGASIPLKYCNLNVGGQNISPALAWDDAPEGTKSFVITCVDLLKKANSWVHWMVIDIPPATVEIPENGSSDNMPVGSVELLNTFGVREYGGPQPPKKALHTYAFTIYALNVDSLALDPDTALTEEELLLEMKDKIIEKATIIGTFKKTD